jgi:hypothetical protein
MLISSLAFLITGSVFGTGVAYVLAEKNSNGQRISISGWEYVSQGDWSPVSVELASGEKILGRYAGECIRPIDAPTDRETITCRGSKEFPLSGATFIGKWEQERNRYKYVCDLGCGRSAPKRIYVYSEEPEGDEEEKN